MSKVLTKEQILSADDLKTEKVKTPEWGGHVFVKTLRGDERDAWEMDVIEAKAGDINKANIRARLAVKSIVDDKGKQIFTTADIAKLGAKSSKALDRIYDVASRLSGVGEKDIEELAKNSGKTQSADSTST